MKVYACRMDGIGTRIQTILQARILADLLEAELEVVWPPISAPYYPEDRLFAADQLSNIFQGLQFFCDGKRTTNIISAENLDLSNTLSASSISGVVKQKSDLAKYLEGKSGIVYDTPYQILPDSEMGCDIGKRVKELWSEINWHENFLSIVENITLNFNLNGATALHARRGDIVERLKRADYEFLKKNGMEEILQRFVAKSTFLKILNEQPLPRSLIVCGEDDEFLTYIEDNFRRRGVTVLSSHKIDMNETTRGFVDLYILAESRRVIAPYHSYFSGAASLLGRSTVRRLPLNISDSIEELFDVIDSAGRADAKIIKALMCEIFAKMLRSEAAREYKNSATGDYISSPSNIFYRSSKALLREKRPGDEAVTAHLSIDYAGDVRFPWKGWAVNKSSETKPSEVIFDCGHFHWVVPIDQERADVARHFEDFTNLTCGFKIDAEVIKDCKGRLTDLVFANNSAWARANISVDLISGPQSTKIEIVFEDDNLIIDGVVFRRSLEGAIVAHIDVGGVANRASCGGWAVDTALLSAADFVAVIQEQGAQKFDICLPRPDVSDALGNRKYLLSGFSLSSEILQEFCSGNNRLVVFSSERYQDLNL
ncbi:hypothetical protein FV228_11755 [Methylobacterium sp. WL18]|uniref:hypothetical protein n=1 Tax=Methylobacterium sp. WL18 TaxID=2603897 RepID=UPI0011C7FB79|nr:hypothetical protein [Methylobacterium sp. WL18]TXN71117.1 hypothetical protein FV228_11755 [Methylobacterium sp. WL18]